MKDIIQIIDSNYSMNIRNDYLNGKKINVYIPTSKNMGILDRMLTEIEKGTNNSYLLSGAYGTGKSYFSSVFSYILSEGFNKNDINQLLKNIEKKNLSAYETIMSYNEKDYVIIFAEDYFSSFKRSIISGIQTAIGKHNLKIKLNTTFDIILSKVNLWEEAYPAFFDKFKLELEKAGYNLTDFKLAIENFSAKEYDLFCDIYKIIFAGEKFYALDADYSFDSILKDFENKVMSLNKYKGILYVFDEFGRYLETNMRELDVKEIQDMAEYCNFENRSSLLLITHKDIFSYTNRLNNKESINEWEKVSGRFRKEHLNFEKTNMLEIISNLMIKNENYESYKATNKNDFDCYKNFLKLSNYKAQNIDELIDKFYPLNIVSANILVTLSQKIAQNERTIFAFLCSNEKNSIKTLMQSQNYFLFDLDVIYDYFKDNFRFFASESLEYKTYLNAENALKNATTKDQEKFIKSLALIYINNNNSEVEPTKETLEIILRESIDSIFEELDKLNIVIYRRHYNHYKLVEELDLNVDREVAKYVDEKLGQINYLDVLNKNIKLPVFYPHEYNEENYITRYANQYYLDFSSVPKHKNLPFNIYEDASIFYLIDIEGIDNYDDYLTLLKDKDIIVVFNKNREKLNISRNLRELEAIERLYHSERDKYQKNDIVRNEILSYKKELISYIQSELNNYFSYKNTTYIFPGYSNPVSLRNNYELIKVLSKYLTSKYNKFIPLNYELINKTKLSTPMKLARKEILTKLLKDEFISFSIADFDSYFKNSGAENTLARIFIHNNEFLDLDTHEITFKNISFLNREYAYQDLYKEIISMISHRVNYKELILKYTSNTGNYGIRRAVFMFFMALIHIKHIDEISILNSNGNEIPFSVDLISELEKSPKDYSTVFLKDNREKKDYLNELENLFSKTTIKSGNKVNDVFNAMRTFFYELPRFIINSASKEKKGLGRVISSLMREKSPSEFIFSNIPKSYKSTSLLETINLFKEDLIFIKDKLGESEKLLEEEILKQLEIESNNLNSALPIWKESIQVLDVPIKIWLKNYSYESKIKFLKDITKKIKGFDYYNWNDKNDFNDFFIKLKLQFKPLKKSYGKKVIIDGVELNVSTDEMKSKLGSVLKNKLEISLKNMGQTVSDEEKRQILMELLLEL